MGEILQNLYRVDDGGSRLVHSWSLGSTNYNVVGRDSWEVAEQQLLDAASTLALEPGIYRLDAIATYSHKVIETVTRTLPMPQAYLGLSYSGSQDKPPRAAVWALHDHYESSTLSAIAEHYETFRSHYDGRLGSEELYEATGYQARSSAYVVTGSRDTQPTQIRDRSTSLERSLLLAESAALTGWKDVQVWHDGDMIATFDVADHASTVLKLQFRAGPPSGLERRPYPVFIAEDGTVEKPSFWEMSHLVGFQPDPETQEIALTSERFFKVPDLAVGLYPVFASSSGEIFTVVEPIDHVTRHYKVSRGGASQG